MHQNSISTGLLFPTYEHSDLVALVERKKKIEWMGLFLAFNIDEYAHLLLRVTGWVFLYSIEKKRKQKIKRQRNCCVTRSWLNIHTHFCSQIIRRAKFTNKKNVVCLPITRYIRIASNYYCLKTKSLTLISVDWGIHTNKRIGISINLSVHSF